MTHRVLGWCLDICVLDESLKHDSCCICEIISSTLEKVHAIATATSRPMPTTVLLASDNCVRESKNSHVLSYLVNLCAHYKVRCSGLINLRKSHTHDVIDQLWGVLARRIARCDKLLSPQSVISVLEAELERPGLKGWIGTSTLVRVYKLDCVRPWNRHYNEQRVGLREGSDPMILLTTYSSTCFAEDRQ